MNTTSITQRVAAKAGNPFDLVREVRVVRLHKLFTVLRRHDRLQHGIELAVLERAVLVESHELSVEPENRRLATSQVKIRRATLRHLTKEALELHHVAQ